MSIGEKSLAGGNPWGSTPGEFRMSQRTFYRALSQPRPVDGKNSHKTLTPFPLLVLARQAHLRVIHETSREGLKCRLL